MGTTLLGVDLDDSRLEGLVERLLTDEELEALTDGGRDRDESDDPSDDADSTDSADGPDDDGDSDLGSMADESSVDGSTPGGSPVDTGGRDASLVQETPNPNGIPGVSDEGSEDEDESGGIGATLRAHWKKIVAAVVAVAVLGVVAWKYGGTVAGAVKSKLGRGDSEDETDVGPTGRTPPGEPVDIVDDAVAADDGGADAGVAGADETGATVGQPTGGAVDDGPTEEDPTVDGEPESGTDAGALVGLAALALVAALVRKFGEDRPRDPLVDGPADDADEP